MTPLAGHGRYPFSPIRDRAAFDWPGGRRLAVYVGMNLECFAFGTGLGAVLAPGTAPDPAAGERDVLNYAWRDYGNRVGVWRMLELFDQLALPTTALVNAAMYEEAPEVVAAFHARGDEIAGHGRTNAERQASLAEAEEAALIADTTAAIHAAHGAPPRGWLGPWISQSATTPDLLAEAGYAYLLDWCHDDQPVWMATRDRGDGAGPGRILSVPYPQEINDIPAIVARRQEAATFADMIVDGFETLLADSVQAPRVMGIALHAYIMGQPHRMKHLARALGHIRAVGDGRVWFTTAGAIATHFAGLSADAD
ncbi:MAG: polysaccharide deacetylase family protein [Pseudomonadota bacterium]